jgi:hypothetical protein
MVHMENYFAKIIRPDLPSTRRWDRNRAP